MVPGLNSRVFKTTQLPADLWLWCIFFGALELVWGQLITLIPVERFPSIPLPWKKKGADQQGKGMSE